MRGTDEIDGAALGNASSEWTTVTYEIPGERRVGAIPKSMLMLARGGVSGTTSGC